MTKKHIDSITLSMFEERGRILVLAASWFRACGSGIIKGFIKY